jgi:tetratricopeptide (TPR) repeat protein
MRSRSIDVIGFESATSSVLEGLDTMAIADRLNVQHVLAGSIAADGVNLRIEMQLLDRAGDALWNSIIEDSLANLFSIQEDIATSVESRLGAGDRTIPVAEVAANRCWIPNDPEAIDKYFTARTYADLRTESEESKEQVRTAIRSYEELIEEYPNFAEAYTGLAWAQMHQGVYDAENALPNRHELAIGLATQALQHCPTLTEAIHILPNQWDHENGWISTHRQLAAFIELEPHRTENYQRLARFYRETGFFDRALAVAERDYQLNPLGPRTIKELGFTLQKLRRWDEAIAKFDLAAELGSTGPNWPRLTVNWSNCGGDITCLLDNLPSEMEPLRERFAKIYIEPANEMEAEAAVDAAMELVREIDLVNWFNGSSCQVDYLTPLFYELFDYYVENEGQIYWHMPNTWNPECGRVWSDPRFRDVVEELRLDELWREIGWPQACQPDGDSFTCGAG